MKTITEILNQPEEIREVTFEEYAEILRDSKVTVEPLLSEL